MRTHEVELPAGLVVKMRSFQVQDENLLANPKSIRKGLATTDLLKAVTVELLDPGLYPFEDRVDWNRVLQGERNDALRQNRIFTNDKWFTFRQPCPRCNTLIETDVDISAWEPDEHEEGAEKPEASFQVMQLPESSQDHVRNGTPLSCTLPGCEVKVEFRLLRGSDDKMLQKIRKQSSDTLSSAYLRFITTKVDGIEGGNDLKEFFRNLETRDAAFLRHSFNEADCGIDQEILFECGTCDHLWQDDVRFDQDFLFPRFRKNPIKTR